MDDGLNGDQTADIVGCESEARYILLLFGACQTNEMRTRSGRDVDEIWMEFE